jgi:hypothetical protein
MRLLPPIRIWLPVVCCLLLLMPALQAQTLRGRILGDVNIVAQGDCAIIDVCFNHPVRYVKHFSLPSVAQTGTQLLPIVVSPTESDALFKRETVRLQPGNPATLAQVMYEGNLEGGPLLTLVFDKPVAFQVKPDKGDRRLTIAVSGVGRPDSCVQ